MVKEKVKGMNKNFGFEVNKPFYVVSKMWMGRVLEVVGGRNIVIRTRSTRSSQLFYFD